jgi:hypothetical protein
LKKETEAILDAEKKKLEDKQHKTQQEMKALVDLNITYKLTGGRKDAWEDVPILSADEQQRYTEQIQLLMEDKRTIERQAKQLESLEQEKTNLELQIKERDKELATLRSDMQSLQRGNSTAQHQIKDSKINLLQSENQELKLKIISFQTENQSLKHRIDECDMQVSEKHEYCATTIQQAQTLNALEQDKRNTDNEMERLKASYMTLQQLLKSKENVIVSLNLENQILSTVNQGNRQGATDTVDSLKNLLQAEANETELVKQNMELLLANEKQRNDALAQEIRALKQERPQQQATVQNTGPSNNNINSTHSSPTQHEQHDDSYNDLNYESEESDGDDIN